MDDQEPETMLSCEVCGSYTIYQGWQDVRELEKTVTDKNGVVWACFEAVPGSQHYRCKEHFTLAGTGKIVYLKDQVGT